ncbi:hypothetical protein EJB05_47258, partial [Eragrostis curvula]
MNFRVTKSLPFLVGPAEATPGSTLRLTAMDTALASLPMAALFIFDRPIDQAAETIKRALSRALVPYYPVAGRLAASAHGLTIACTGEDVALVGALASCTLQDARLTDPRPLVRVEELTPTYAEHYRKDPPLLLMQVTQFSCGGLVVGVTWDHVIADGVGMPQFLQDVGEFARGSPSPSVGPMRLDYCLPDLPPPIISMTKALVSSSAHNDFPSSDITVPMSFINRVKAEFRGHKDGDYMAPCSPPYGTKARVPYTFVDGAAYIAGEMGGRLQGMSGYDTLYVTSWWNLGFDDVDFGAGGPVRVMGHMERKVVPACILCGRKDKADGVAAMALCVRVEHQEAFHAELRRLE